MRVRLTQIDGKLPNLALMKLAHWHNTKGDEVWFSRHPTPQLWEPSYDRSYISAIFFWSKPIIDKAVLAFPESVVGGTGTQQFHTVEELIGEDVYEHYDYSIYPDYPFSLGFTQRGCRLRCSFCIVPTKEGRNKAVNTIADIWRPATPHCVLLLDNDFFGQPKEEWRARIEELREGRYKVSFNQGINVRLLNAEAASAIASIQYYDDSFRTRRLYTAWDNIGDERIFFRGLDLLTQAGIRAAHVMVYMLIGFKEDETMDEILYRYHRLKDAGCLPYPMVYNNESRELKRFQRWVIRRYDEFVSWEDFGKAPKRLEATVPRLL